MAFSLGVQRGLLPGGGVPLKAQRSTGRTRVISEPAAGTAVPDVTKQVRTRRHHQCIEHVQGRGAGHATTLRSERPPPPMQNARDGGVPAALCPQHRTLRAHTASTS
jgi:hypothetical protein